MTTLAASYEACRRLNRAHGTTYYWATLVLPRVTRPHVHALYGFCRHADEIVDGPGAPTAPGCADPGRRLALEQLSNRLFADLAQGDSDHEILKAVVHTARVTGLDPDLFRRFLRSMAMDLTVHRYATWEDLRGYMDGSAAVIGEMMLPLLGASTAAARAPARALGEAFQLTNFLRDVGEDLDRGRVYLPQEDLARFGADPGRRRADGPWCALMRFEIDRCRDLYARADTGLALLAPAARRAIGAARVLYSGILDEIEANGYDVFTGRARVPRRRKAAVVAAALVPRRPPAPARGGSPAT